MYASASKRLSTLITLFIIFPILCLIVSAGCNESESRTQAGGDGSGPRVIKVSVQTVEPVAVRDVLVLPGGTEAWHDVLLAADKTGAVEWIGPEEGAAVSAGDLLVKIDVSSLKAGLDRMESAYALADALYQRRKRLAERKIINQEALDHSETDRSMARANLEQARVEYERGFVRAPISGMVNKLFVDEGEFINRGEPLVDLVNVDKIKINLNVPEMDVRFFRPGQEADVRVDAFPEKTLAGVVDFVAFKADEATRTFPVRVQVKNPGHEIRPGMIARVSLTRRVFPDALVAPLFALVDKGGERLLFVEEDGVARARTVETGVIKGDRIHIVKGLSPGDRLIVKGQTEVEEGMKVQVP